jgi:hypothetical protein
LLVSVTLVKFSMPWLKNGAARTQPPAARAAVTARGQSAFERHIVHRQPARRQFHPAGHVKQPEGRRVVGRIGVTLDGGAVAVDSQVAEDGRQAVRTVPEVVDLRQIIGTGGEVDDVAVGIAVAVGGVDGGDQAVGSVHVARRHVEHRRRQPRLQVLQHRPNRPPPRRLASLPAALGQHST